MAFSLNSVPSFNYTTLQAKLQYPTTRYSGDSGHKIIYIAASSGPWFGLRKNRKEKKLGLFSLAAKSNQVTANSIDKEFGNAKKPPADDLLLPAKPLTTSSPGDDIKHESNAKISLPQTHDASDGVPSDGVPSDVKVDTVSSPKLLKRSSLTAREKLRAARVLSRYTDSKPTKSEFGSKVLDALRESDRGKKRSRLPEAPTNMLDDSKRGMPKPGLTFDFPGGYDLFVIVLSFVLITTTMVATTFIVWKLGAIHFNDN